MRPAIFGGQGSFTTPVSGASTEAVSISVTLPDPAPVLHEQRRITPEQVKRSANRAVNPLQRLSTVSVEGRQAVKIARADERIAMAKAGTAAARNARNAEIEGTYFQLLIAQRQLTSADWKLRSSENHPLYAAARSALCTNQRHRASRSTPGKGGVRGPPE